MDSNKGSALTSEDEVGHGVVEDEVGMRHEVARGGHVVDAPFHGEGVHVARVSSDEREMQVLNAAYLAPRTV